MSKTLKARMEAKPLSGKGSRQPVLKLPSVMPDGTRIRVHPLLYLLRRHAENVDGNKSDVARTLGIKPQSLYKWERACERDRNFPLPVLRAKQFANLFNVVPSIFRPDFPWGI